VFPECQRGAALGTVTDPVYRHAMIDQASNESFANHRIIFDQKDSHRLGRAFPLPSDGNAVVPDDGNVPLLTVLCELICS
jgi:hypothetical protein